MHCKEEDPAYAETIGYSFLVISPVLLCFCFPAQKYIGRFQKELLAASFGTICGFIFFEVIPVIMKDAHAHILSAKAFSDKEKRARIWILSCTIFIGMLFAALLGLLHEVMEHKHCEEEAKEIRSASKSKEGFKLRIGCLSWIPSTCKVVWIGTALHNLADGMILGMEPTWTVTLALLIHEIIHTLCNVTFYMTLGMTKVQAIILRIGSCLFVFLGSLGMRVMNKFLKEFHIYGHALVLGIFLYMMLVDVLPIMTGDQQHNHCMEPDEEDTCEEKAKESGDGFAATASKSSETNREETSVGIEVADGPCDHHHHPHPRSSIRRKMRLLAIIAIFFAIVAGSIGLLPETHKCSGECGGGKHHHQHHTDCHVRHCGDTTAHGNHHS